MLSTALCLLLVLPAQQAQPPAYAAALARTAQRCRIEIDHAAPTFPVKTTWGPIQGKKAAPKNLERYAPLLTRELALLPASLLEKARLRRVVLCEELAFAGQRRNAVPAFELDALYLEVSRGSQHPRYLAAVIHHDFFHMVDYRDDGRLYQDDAWAALNPPGFRYGNGGKNWQHDGKTTQYTTKHPGFLTHYMTTGVEEDKAELYAQLVVNPARVKERCKEDAFLRAKVARLKALVAAFCPDINEDFWKKCERLDRPAM